jgi:acetolactate synthase-1/2/3 large subunit
MVTPSGATGAEILIDSLIAQGVDTIFELPGLQLDHIFNALYERRNEVRVIHTRHERATASMAFGYAQAGGRVGTCLVVPGPGVLNTTAALSATYKWSWQP